MLHDSVFRTGTTLMQAACSTFRLSQFVDSDCIKPLVLGCMNLWTACRTYFQSLHSIFSCSSQPPMISMMICGHKLVHIMLLLTCMYLCSSPSSGSLQVQFHARGPSGKARVTADMYQDSSKQWQYAFLFVDVDAPVPQRVVIVGPQYGQ